MCKEGKEGEKTCLQDVEKKCSCMADQYCSKNNTCVQAKPVLEVEGAGKDINQRLARKVGILQFTSYANA